jgi:hypothetical protein
MAPATARIEPISSGHHPAQNLAIREAVCLGADTAGTTYKLRAGAAVAFPVTAHGMALTISCVRLGPEDVRAPETEVKFM